MSNHAVILLTLVMLKAFVVNCSNTASFRYYIFNPTALRDDFNANSVQFSELTLKYNGKRVSTSLAIATNPNGNNPDTQTPIKAIDQDVTSKFLDFNKGSLVIDFGTSTSITTYTFATGDDFPERDPISWIFSGSNDNLNWNILDSKTNYATTTSRETYLPDFTIVLPLASPTVIPTDRPSIIPSQTPSAFPSTRPSVNPSIAPSQPTGRPTAQPSSQPSAIPTLVFRNRTKLASILGYRPPNQFAFAVLSPNTSSSSTGGFEAIVYDNEAEITEGKVMRHSNIVSMTSSRHAFAAITAGGQLVCWGDAFSIQGWEGYTTPSIKEDRYAQIVSSEHAFAAWTMTGQIVAFGAAAHGGYLPSEIQDWLSNNAMKVQGVVGSHSAFCLWTESGLVQCWGNAHSGGLMSSILHPEVHNIEQIYATQGAFAARSYEGFVYVWGECYYGGCLPSSVVRLTEVAHIIPTPVVFLAITTDRYLLAWGHPLFGGSMNGNSDILLMKQVILHDVQYVSYTSCAIAIITANQSVQSWGQADCGGEDITSNAYLQSLLVNITMIYSNDRAFAAVRRRSNESQSDEVVVWGDATYGGRYRDGGHVVPIPVENNTHAEVVKVVSTRSAFALLTSTGQVMSWGCAEEGGEGADALQYLLSSSSSTTNERAPVVVEDIIGNEIAFLARLSNGSYVGWGHPIVIPTTTPGAVLFTV